MKLFAQTRIHIIGLGLIGGSIARKLRAQNDTQIITGFDSNKAYLECARDERVLSEIGSDDETHERLCGEADLIIVALPTLAIAKALDDICVHIKPTTVVTDVGSVKANILASARRLEHEQSAVWVKNFVPGHPIAGSEKSGYHASSSNLFENRNVIITPDTSVESAAVALVNLLWRQLGANVIAMDVIQHDQVLAATSHLPHLLSYTLVDVLLQRDQSEDIFRYAAGGFADFSRLASSDPDMWADIFIANGDETVNVLDAYIERLESLKTTLIAKDRDSLRAVFAQSKSGRDQFINQFYNPMTQNNINAEERVDFRVQPGAQVLGNIRVPGDKSISHRSIIFGSIANGITQVSGFLEGEDALNTLAAFREMGVTIQGPKHGKLTIFGVGKHGLQAPTKPLYMGNSGTAMRLLAGLLAAQSFDSELTGDDSLSGRPMGRIITPLVGMGANLSGTAAGSPPLRIAPANLTGTNYDMPMASAQVKSCVLLAGLYAEGETSVREPAPCRDHTERMLQGFGYPVWQEEGVTRLNCNSELTATHIDVPADISSAAFFLVAAAITPGAELKLSHVGVNPTRIGVINILTAMGADITLSNRRNVGGEPVADIQVKYSALKGITIPEQEIPLAIDEFPVLFIAAACAAGNTILRGAEELRVKESDRIAAMADGLKALGVEHEVYEDGISIVGSTDEIAYGGGEIDSQHDHRIAMAFAIAGGRAGAPITIRNCANVATSFPGFVKLAQQVGLRVSSETLAG